MSLYATSEHKSNKPEGLDAQVFPVAHVWLGSSDCVIGDTNLVQPWPALLDRGRGRLQGSNRPIEVLYQRGWALPTSWPPLDFKPHGCAALRRQIPFAGHGPRRAPPPRRALDRTCQVFELNRSLIKLLTDAYAF